jgi:hypothetical protein
MTVIAITMLQLKPGVRWQDAQATIKTGNDLIRKHGGENVTTMAAMLAGEMSGNVGTLWTAPDWARFGEVFNAIMNDSEIQALMESSTGPDGPTLGWSTYVNQTIPDL